MPERLLTIDSLHTEFPTRHGVVRAADGVSLDVRRGECLGVVGESGSGKSVTFASVMRLVRPPGRIVSGSIVFDGRDLTQLDDAAMRRLRGKDMAMTMQDALTALNPAIRVGTQIVEVLRAHDDGEAGRSHGAARRRAVELLKMVGIPDAERRVDDYPHQFSGGMRQRVMIAIALACRPKLLIADEPTTALDVTVQAQVLELIAELRAALGMSVVLITHDLGIVADYCDRVAVMYAGQVVETGPTMEVLTRPVHPYTSGLLRSVPRLERLTDPVRPIPGQMPDLSAPATACRFLPRCSQGRAACEHPIDMRQLGAGRAARCVLAEAAHAG